MDKNNNLDKIPFTDLPMPDVNNKRGRPRKVLGAAKILLPKKTIQFLDSLSQHGIMTRALRETGQDKRADGSTMRHDELSKKGREILRNPKAQYYLKQLQEEMFELNVHNLTKCINETYDFYIELREQKKYREANIAHQRYISLMGLGLANVEPPINVNTQIVSNSDGGFTINYLTPKDIKDDNIDDEKTID